MVPVYIAPKPRPRSTARPARSRSRIVPSPADEPLLHALATYYLLTAEQVCRLVYSAGSLTYAKARLKRLVDGGVCERYEQPRRTRHGALPYVYRLSAKGVAFTQRVLGVGDAPHVRPARVGDYTYLRFEHLRCLNVVLISVELLCRRLPYLELRQLLHDEVLQRTPFHVPLPDGTTARVIPDAWVDLRIHEADGDYQECYALELDRGTERSAAWQAKVAALVAWASGPYQAALGAEALAFAVVTTAGERRAAQLVDWTAQELARLGRQDLGSRFHITALDAATVAPEAFFLTPVWRQPLGQQLAPLLLLADGGHA